MEWEGDSMMNVLLWAAAYCRRVSQAQNVQVMNELVNELEHKWPLVIIS